MLSVRQYKLALRIIILQTVFPFCFLRRCIRIYTAEHMAEVRCDKLRWQSHDPLVPRSAEEEGGGVSPAIRGSDVSC